MIQFLTVVALVLFILSVIPVGIFAWVSLLIALEDDSMTRRTTHFRTNWWRRA